MAGLIKNIFRVFVFALVVPMFSADAASQSPRATSSKVLTRNQTVDNNASIRRSATSVIARSTSANKRHSKTIVTARPAMARTALKTSGRSGTRVVSSGANLSRAATTSKAGTVRSATNKIAKSVLGAGHLSRAGVSRATAVFDDVIKIGGGYSTCRDAYATCMDQFCAVANNTYRRCFCSNRFLSFKETSDNLDKAIDMLADFRDNNLNAIDKSADEVTAMYSATAGESALTKDVSESQKKLDEIADVLSGKSTSGKQSLSSSLGILDFNTLTDTSDIFSDFSGSSIFNQSSSSSITGLEGDALYQRASSQCAAITRESCAGGSAMFDLASSAYSIMITQDCNIFEKDLNTKKEVAATKVREAEQILREARLEDYRAHNSKDFNECLTKVENDVQEKACGANYEKCLDYTGKYIDANTGEPKYESIFDISSIAPKLVDNGDILAANPRWNTELEEKRKYAEQSLDGCRSLAPDVWNDFKRMTLIRIAQAQDDVVQRAKDNCISYIKECYDQQTGKLNDWGSTGDSQYNFTAGAVVTARATCYERVMGCAALYGGSEGCQYDRATGKFSVVNGQKCGLQALLTFADTVDSAKVASACEDTLNARAHELCDPQTTYKMNFDGTYQLDAFGEQIVSQYPDGCATMPRSQLRADLTAHAQRMCALDMIRNDKSNTIGDSSAFTTETVNRVIKSIFDKLNIAFTTGCEDSGGVWYDDGIAAVASWISGNLTINDLNQDYYKTYYGGTSLQSILGSIKAGDMGVCLEASVSKSCEAAGGTYNGSECTELNYNQMCNWLSGTPNESSKSCSISEQKQSNSGADLGKYKLGTIGLPIPVKGIP